MDTEKKHTRGPWKIEQEEVWAILGQDGGRLATMNWLKGSFGGQGRRGSDEVRANAYLIAAAPEMLKALQAQQEVVLIANEEKDSDDWGERFRASVEKANDLLEKALRLATQPNDQDGN